MTALTSACNNEQRREVMCSAFSSHCAGLLQLTALQRTGWPLLWGGSDRLCSTVTDRKVAKQLSDA